jgi:hypothetical protein
MGDSFFYTKNPYERENTLAMIQNMEDTINIGLDLWEYLKKWFKELWK